MHKNSPLKWLISLSLALILLLHPRMSYGAQILVKSYEMPQQSASRVITFTLQCNSWESGAAMMKRFAVLTQAVVERMKRLPPSLSQRNGLIYLHEMSAYRDGYSDSTLLDILRRCRTYGVTSLVIETNFGDGIVGELFKKHLINTKQHIHIEEVRANVRKEDRIIDSLEPVLNQHRLIVDRGVIDWDYASNKDSPAEERLLYMLFYQMSRMCREKRAVKHDDRLDCLAQGVKYFTDALSISAQDQIVARKREEWNNMLAEFLDDPEASANHMVLGMNLDQRNEARGHNTKTTTITGVRSITHLYRGREGWTHSPVPNIL